MAQIEPKTEITTIRTPKSSLQTPVRMPLTPQLLDVTAPAGEGMGLSDLLRILYRHRFKLLAFIATGVAAAVVLQLIIPKLYEATATVKIDRHQIAVSTGVDTPTGPSADDMDQIITTAIELAQSDTVLRPVAEKYHLLEEEKQLSGLKPDEILAKRESPIELKKLKITRPPNTYLLRITYRAHNPKLASDVANAIAQSLSDHANDSGKATLAEASTKVNANIAALHQKVLDANEQLANYAKQLQMSDPDQKVSTLTSRLNQLNQELTTVQAERVNREATLEQLQKSKSLATAQAADTLHTTAPDSALNDTLVRLNAARQQFAAVRSFYGPTHPEYTKAQDQVNELTKQLNDQIDVSAQRASVNFQQSRERERQLTTLVAAAKAEVDGLQAKAQTYNQLKQEADSNSKLYQDLTSRAMVADINKEFNNAEISIFSAARPPLEHIFPKFSLNLALGLVLSSILGVLAVVLVNAFDTSFSDPKEVAERLQIDVLTVVPAIKSLPPLYGETNVVALTPSSRSSRSGDMTGRYNESIRNLRTVIGLIMLDGQVKSIQITSALPGEGKSSTTAQLATSFAQIGRKVLLIDTDMRRPTQHKVFGVAMTPGLSDVLEGYNGIAEAIVPTEHPGLYLLPSGPISRNAAELISMRFSAVLAKVSRDFDLVILDGPPVHGASETQEIAGLADAVLVVTKSSGTSGKIVSSALDILLRARARVIGLVMNQSLAKDESTYSYYYSPKEAKTADGFEV